MSIDRILLFVCSNSRNCTVVTKLAQEANIEIIRLDSKGAREMARKSKIKLDVVPMLVVMYQDDNLQAFKGAQKCSDWINQYQHAVSGGEGNSEGGEIEGIESVASVPQPKSDAKQSKMSDLKSRAADMQRQREQLWGAQDSREH